MIAEGLGNFCVGIVNFVGWMFGSFGVLWIAAGLFALWLLSKAVLVFGPMKMCWRCKGKGHIGGLLGGRAECSWCKGKGIRPRIGSGK
jgi:hypothetical protein